MAVLRGRGRSPSAPATAASPNSCAWKRTHRRGGARRRHCRARSRAPFRSAFSARREIAQVPGLAGPSGCRHRRADNRPSGSAGVALELALPRMDGRRPSAEDLDPGRDGARARRASEDRVPPAPDVWRCHGITSACGVRVRLRASRVRTASRRVIVTPLERRPAQRASGGTETSVAMPLAVTSGVPAGHRAEIHPVAEPVVRRVPTVSPGQHRPRPREARCRSRHRSGAARWATPPDPEWASPAASCASAAERCWLAAGVGGTVRSSAQQLGAGMPNSRSDLADVLQQRRDEVGARRRRDRDAEGQVQAAGEPRDLVEPQELRLIDRSVAFQRSFEPVPMISSLTSGLPILDHLGEMRERLRSTVRLPHLPHADARRGIHADDRWQRGDRDLDGDGIDVEPFEVIDAEGVGRVAGVLGIGEHRRVPPEVEGIERGRQVDREGLLALSGEHPDARCPRCRRCPLRPAPGSWAWSGRPRSTAPRRAVAPLGRELSSENTRVTRRSARGPHGVLLAKAEALRSGPVEGRDGGGRPGTGSTPAYGTGRSPKGARSAV